MCERAGPVLSAPRVCSCGGGVHPGAQSDHTGPYGPAPLPVSAAGHPAQAPVLQRVSLPTYPSALIRAVNNCTTVLYLKWLSPQNICVSFRFADTLELADDMAIDIPHIWLYLAELLSPVLRDGGFSMRELFR